MTSSLENLSQGIRHRLEKSIIIDRLEQGHGYDEKPGKKNV